MKQGVCNSLQNFRNEVDANDKLKNVTADVGYHFRMPFVVHSNHVSKELKSLCCSFDDNCEDVYNALIA